MSLDNPIEPINLPNSASNPKKYKLPNSIFESPFVLPANNDQPIRYGLPNVEYGFEEIKLPSGIVELSMELQSQLPSAFTEAVRYVHQGISPVIVDGRVELTDNIFDIHHIVKRSYVKADAVAAKKFLPFKGTVEKTYDLLTDYTNNPYRLVRANGLKGHMLINLIALNFNFHHDVVEGSEFNDLVQVALFENQFLQIPIPQFLMAFNIFNMHMRLNLLRDFVQAKFDEQKKIMWESRDIKVLEKANREIFPWKQMLVEIENIPAMSAEIRRDFPDIYHLWVNTMLKYNGAEFLRNSIEA